MRHHNETLKVAIIGGGIAGSSVAIYLSEIGLDVTLFEKESSLVSGPPMCHLHAGGNLYREISDEQCVKLLKQSIELVRFYPHSIDFRPTLIALAHYDAKEPADLLPRLEMLQEEYKKLITDDESNKVLGKSEEYFKLYSKEDLESFKLLENVTRPSSSDEWMITVAKNLDFSKVKFPLILVQEYGLNIFRLSATASLSLEKMKNATILLKREVTKIEQIQEGYHLFYKENNATKKATFDYLINAAGFLSGKIDDMLKLPRKRLVEFKAAYVTQCRLQNNNWPEIIFPGERGTPKGMGQFTPYPNGYVQIHGMTKDITLFENGLVKSTDKSAQPRLDAKFLEKIEYKWHETEIKQRTDTAIEYIANFIPAFKNARVASKPLFGAQQIPGDDATLRASEVSFEGQRYARCEIVKASSVLTMADAIAHKLIELKLLDASFYGHRDFHHVDAMNERAIALLARKIAKSREYPENLADINFVFNDAR